MEYFLDVEKINSVFKNLSDILGFELEALLYFISIFFVIGIAICHFFIISKFSPLIQNVCIIFMGFSLLYFNFGMDIIHLYIIFLFSFIILKTIPDSLASIILITIASMTHYIYGTWVFNQDRYSINWTIPYCIMILKMISLHWDAYDSFSNNAELSPYQLNNKLTKEIEILEVLAFYVNPLTTLAGPQFSLEHHRKWIAGLYFPNNHASDQKKEEFNMTIFKYALSRFILGMFCVGVYTVSFKYLSTSDFLSENFLKKWSFPQRVFFLFAYTHFHFVQKYMSVWLLIETACVIAGLGFEYPVEQYDSISLVEPNFCAGTVPITFFLSYSTKHLVNSFNLTTNRWVLHYCFKRLKFLNNRTISQLFSMIFLAAWHGLRSGYFVLFATELFVMNVELGILKLLNKLNLQQYFDSTSGRTFGMIIGKLWILFSIPHAIAAFTLLDFEDYEPVFRRNYYIGCIPFAWPVIEVVTNILF